LEALWATMEPQERNIVIGVQAYRWLSTRDSEAPFFFVVAAVDGGHMRRL